MNTALWIVQGLLALAFLMAGVMKVSQPKEKLVDKLGEWVNDFSESTLRLIGTVEILGAFGLVLPALTGILPWLTGLAAVGLALTMIGGALVHLKHKENAKVIAPAVLLLLAAFVGYGRFVVVPFVA